MYIKSVHKLWSSLFSLRIWLNVVGAINETEKKRERERTCRICSTFTVLSLLHRLLSLKLFHRRMCEGSESVYGLRRGQRDGLGTTTRDKQFERGKDGHDLPGIEGTRRSRRRRVRYDPEAVI